jgi:uncharacterized cupredoxin-like copper-binding protein
VGCVGGIGAAIGAALVLAGCTSSGPVAALEGPAILSSDAATRTVHLLLDGGENDAYGGFNFDGYGDGGMTVRVPAGWTVDVTFKNESTTFTHSCGVAQDAPISTNAGPVVFGATTPDPTTGLPFGATAHFSFVATRAGRYRIVCFVTAHEADGMWDWFVVTTGGRPSVST